MLRETQKKELRALAEVYFKIFTSDEWRYNWLTYDNTFRYLSDMYAAPRSLAYTFFENNTIIGGCFGDISDYFKTAQYFIKEIFIDISLQKKGAGSSHLALVEADLKLRGIKSVTLYTSKSIPAFAFYKKNGYTEGSDSVFMAKPL